MTSRPSSTAVGVVARLPGELPAGYTGESAPAVAGRSPVARGPDPEALIRDGAVSPDPAGTLG
ncbi:hypothetical protein VB716_08455 [Synechococcus sp. CCY9201]|nr:hypothetical protein [Synechococcus sp. CCY9201]